MDSHERNWLHNYAHKLDPELRSMIDTRTRSLSRYPHFFRPILNFLKRKRRIPIIIQFFPLRFANKDELFREVLGKHTDSLEELSIIHGYAGTLSIESIKKLAESPAISKIYLDREIKALLDTAVPSIQSQRLWDYGYTGRGITIAILDTGIARHPDFMQPTSRIKAFQDFVNKKSNPYDDNGHGTHCAGSAAGNGFASAGKYRGPAYQANLVVLKILDKAGSGFTSTAIKALDWCLKNRTRFNINIVSLSLGTKAIESYRDDPLCQSVEKVWQNGIVVCTAAGNDGPENKTINTPGIHPAVITVGAADDRNTPQYMDDRVADFSSRGPTIDGLTKPDFLVPGANIIAARAKGSLLDKVLTSQVDEWYLSMSGTSMATPICAGLVAQLLEALPQLTPEEVKNRLLTSCRPLPKADANTQGQGCVNAFYALTILPLS